MISLLKFIPVLFFFGIFTGFAQTKQNDHLMVSESEYVLEHTLSRLEALLKQNEEINLFVKLESLGRQDHNSFASSSETRLLIFGNPKMGTMLMQRDQLAGLDLPLKMLIYKNEKDVKIAYNNLNYLKSRYNLKRAKNLSKVKKVMEKLASETSGAPVKNSGKFVVKLHEGIVSEISDFNFETTYNRLKTLIETNPDFHIYSEIDHFENAEKVNMGLRPTKLILFGNPEITAAIAQENVRSALGLPMKFLVWRDETGQVKISYNDPAFFAKRFGLKEIGQLEIMKNSLKDFSKAAASY